MNKFEKIVSIYGPRLISDVGYSIDDAAAVFGNGGHESGGFEKLQEIKPTVKGSRGGYGWFQWTGPRRRAFEAFCKRNGLKPSDDEANYAFLIYELNSSEKSAIRKTKEAKGLYNKTVAFESAFERAGVKHYDRRFEYAKRARQVLEMENVKIPIPKEKPKVTQKVEEIAKPGITSKTNWLAGIGTFLTSVTAFFSGLHPVVQGILIIGAFAVGGYLIYERQKKSKSVLDAIAVSAINEIEQ